MIKSYLNNPDLSWLSRPLLTINSSHDIYEVIMISSFPSYWFFFDNHISNLWENFCIIRSTYAEQLVPLLLWPTHKFLFHAFHQFYNSPLS